jgi:hypothetical protein
MRTYTVYYKNHRGESCQYKVEATDRFDAKWKAIYNLDIELSEIEYVL